MALLAAPAPESLKITGCDFGETYSFGAAECRILVSSSADHAIHIEAAADDASDSIAPATLDIAPGASVELSARISAGNAIGQANRTFHIRESGRSDVPAHIAVAHGFFMSALDDVAPRIDFGSVDLSADKPEKVVELGSHDSEKFKVEQVIGKPDASDVSIASDGRSVAIRLKPGAEWGILDDVVKLAVDTPHQKEAWVRVHGEIHGEVSPSSNPVWLGFSTSDAIGKQLIALKNRKGSKFRMGDVSLSGVQGKVDTVDCEPSSAACKALRLTMSDQQKPGVFRGKIQVNLPDYDKRLSVSIWGVLQKGSPSGARAASTAAPAQQPPALAGNDAPPPASEIHPDDARAADKKAPAQVVEPRKEVQALPPPPGKGPLLKWTVADDGGVYGYQVFRSESESGPFVLQNQKTIRAQGGPKNSVGSYQWRDEQATPGAAYWYYVGAVSKDGRKKQLSAPQRKSYTP